MRALEIWGGVECSVNRVRDRYFNQLERSGHLQRPADLDAFKAIGITALRTPALWELLQSEADWRVCDAYLERLRCWALGRSCCRGWDSRCRS